MPETHESFAAFALQRPLHYLWGLGADLGIFCSTIVLGSSAIALTLLTRRSRPLHVLSRIWCRLNIWTCGIKVAVEGLEHLEPNQSYVVISNHLSNFDIWCTIAALPLDIRFVAKKELLRIPFFGQALAVSGHIVIDRQNSEEAISTINVAAARSTKGICILFYAEGTRSSDGAVHAFKRGGVTLALRTQLPIVPLSISGTRKFLPKRSVVIRPGGNVKIVLAPPIPTAGRPLDARDVLNDQVRDVVIANYLEVGVMVPCLIVRWCRVAPSEFHKGQRDRRTRRTNRSSS
jgi:1-acyl-sn-glycerol-3-phosphate acyltransferase